MAQYSNQYSWLFWPTVDLEHKRSRSEKRSDIRSVLAMNILFFPYIDAHLSDGKTLKIALFVSALQAVSFHKLQLDVTIFSDVFRTVINDHGISRCFNLLNALLASFTKE